MADLIFDKFELWVRDRSRGCMGQSDIDELCKGDMDLETGDCTFRDQGVQAQWEAWKEASSRIVPLKKALALHRSMVLGGEKESESSEECFRLAME